MITSTSTYFTIHNNYINVWIISYFIVKHIFYWHVKYVVNMPLFKIEYALEVKSSKRKSRFK